MFKNLIKKIQFYIGNNDSVSFVCNQLYAEDFKERLTSVKPKVHCAEGHSYCRVNKPGVCTVLVLPGQQLMKECQWYFTEIALVMRKRVQCTLNCNTIMLNYFNLQWSINKICDNFLYQTKYQVQYGIWLYKVPNIKSC